MTPIRRLLARIRALRALVVLVGVISIVLAVEAVWLWMENDEAGSLALATAVATFALAFGPS